MLENLKVPDIEAPATGGKTFKLAEHRGRPVVLYFYPKDNTPGCTDEGIQFRELFSGFQEAGCDIYGVSRDSMRSHEGFKSKMSFPFELISDPDERLCEAFGVMKLKNMYGKQGARRRAQHLCDRRQRRGAQGMARRQGARARAGSAGFRADAVRSASRLTPHA